MKKPAPSSGLVIRYDYLWRNEARRGSVEGAKVRPCAIVVAVINAQDEQRVMIAPITHTQPESTDGIEIPSGIKRHLNLDDKQSWIITTEVNEIDWNDPGIVPASTTQWEYGYLPSTLAQAMIDAIRDRLNPSKLKVTMREA